VNSHAIFWINKGSPCTIVKAPLAGGAAAPVYTPPSCPYGLAVDENNVYFSSDEAMGIIRKVGTSGENPTIIATKTYFPRDISTDANNVYYSAYEGGVGYITKSTWTQVALIGGFGPVATASGNSSIYWVNFDAMNIQRMFLTGSTTATIVTPMAMSNSDVPKKLTAMDTTISYTTLTDVRQISAFGGTPTVIAPGQATPDGIASDSSGVYWENSTASGTIRKYDANGTVTLATGQGTPVGLALDSTSIYWANSTTGEIMKLAK
jgi:sugar lactone lactonase YvrE